MINKKMMEKFNRKMARRLFIRRIARQAAKVLLMAGLVMITYTAIFRTEYDTGVCLNEEQDGMLYNGEPYYNYISYRSTEAVPGDKVFTVLVLNPFNNYCDDYIYRHDWIVENLLEG